MNMSDSIAEGIKEGKYDRFPVYMTDVSVYHTTTVLIILP